MIIFMTELIIVNYTNQTFLPKLIFVKDNVLVKV